MALLLAFMALCPAILHNLAGRNLAMLVSLTSFPLMLYHFPSGLALRFYSLVTGFITTSTEAGSSVEIVQALVVSSVFLSGIGFGRWEVSAPLKPESAF